mgnify:CR=1 FL=1
MTSTNKAKLAKLRSAKKVFDQKATENLKKLKSLEKKAKEKAAEVLKKELAKLTPVRNTVKSYRRQSAGLKKSIYRLTEGANIMPETGRIIGYKKAKDIYGNRNVIIKLEIPATALRYQDRNKHSAHRWKCRASEAKVLSMTDIHTGKPISQARSISEWDYIYKVGKVCRPQYPFSKYDRACASGIHFFMTESKARRY